MWGQLVSRWWKAGAVSAALLMATAVGGLAPTGEVVRAAALAPRPLDAAVDAQDSTRVLTSDDGRLTLICYYDDSTGELIQCDVVWGPATRATGLRPARLAR